MLFQSLYIYYIYYYIYYWGKESLSWRPIWTWSAHKVLRIWAVFKNDIFLMNIYFMIFMIMIIRCDKLHLCQRFFNTFLVIMFRSFFEAVFLSTTSKSLSWSSQGETAAVATELCCFAQIFNRSKTSKRNIKSFRY